MTPEMNKEWLEKQKQREASGGRTDRKIVSQMPVPGSRTCTAIEYEKTGPSVATVIDDVLRKLLFP
jgi:hypothetical protein